jgi:hypothetical protein
MRQRQHRQLDRRVAREPLREDAQLERMDDVLGVVERDGDRLDPSAVSSRAAHATRC